MRVRIKELIKQNETTYSKVAMALQVTVRTLHKWDAGDRIPIRDNIAALCLFFNCDIKDLIEF